MAAIRYRIPEEYRLFMSHRPPFIPSGWEFLGLDSESPRTLWDENDRLRDSRAMPVDWVHFLNVGDDEFYFLVTDLSSGKSQVKRAFCDDFESLETKAQTCANSFCEFALQVVGTWIVELAQESIHLDKEWRSLQPRLGG